MSNCQCGQQSDNWPGNLCQMCWEAYCAEEFWKFINRTIEQRHNDHQGQTTNHS